MFNTASLKLIHFIPDDNMFNILIKLGSLYMAIRSLVNVKQKLRPRAVEQSFSQPAPQPYSKDFAHCFTLKLTSNLHVFVFPWTNNTLGTRCQVHRGGKELSCLTKNMKKRTVTLQTSH